MCLSFWSAWTHFVCMLMGPYARRHAFFVLCILCLIFSIYNSVSACNRGSVSSVNYRTFLGAGQGSFNWFFVSRICNDWLIFKFQTRADSFLEEETTARQSRKPWLMQVFLLIYWLLCYWWISLFREGSRRQNSSSPQTFFVHFPAPDSECYQHKRGAKMLAC
jgi:hypothetical protein